MPLPDRTKQDNWPLKPTLQLPAVLYTTALQPVLFKSFDLSYFPICLCACSLWHTCGGQMAACESQLSPSTL